VLRERGRLMDLTELHKNFLEGTLDEKSNTLNLFLKLGSEKVSEANSHINIKKFIYLATGLLIRSPKNFRDLFIKKCSPEVKQKIYEAMKEKPEYLGLTYDSINDPKEKAISQQQDLQILNQYREIYLKAEQRKKDHETWMAKNERASYLQRQEKQWKMALQEKNHEIIVDPLSILIINLICEHKFTEAAKKFIEAEIKVQRCVILDRDKNKQTKETGSFIEEVEKMMLAMRSAKKENGDIDENENDLPDAYYRAKICIDHLKGMQAV